MVQVVRCRKYRLLTDEIRRKIYRLKASGLSNRAIAQVVGQGHETVNYVVRPFGGVFTPDMFVSRPASRLSFEDRAEIYAGIAAGESLPKSGCVSDATFQLFLARLAELLAVRVTNPASRIEMLCVALVVRNSRNWDRTRY
jgi:Helix-turn-helix domain